ncbi:MAG TPA: hypothetical protein VNO52_14615 [Methylomirabilota bacterium]|nr:hypothetical protein [Methylomirabilota bacterium]
MRHLLVGLRLLAVVSARAADRPNKKPVAGAITLGSAHGQGAVNS